MIGEQHLVYPKSGVERMGIAGFVILSSGTPLVITPELVTLAKVKFITIDPAIYVEGSEIDPTPQPAPPIVSPTPQPVPGPSPVQPAPTPAPAPQPAPTPVQADPGPLPSIDTPMADAVIERAKTMKPEEIDAMSDEQLKEFITAVGHETVGRRRGVLVRQAKQFIQAAQSNS